MQRSLICHLAGQKRLAVVFQSDGQTPEPLRPSTIQMALDLDSIDHWFLFLLLDYVELGASQRLQHSRQVVVVSYLLRGIRRIIRVRLEGESVKRAAIR